VIGLLGYWDLVEGAVTTEDAEAGKSLVEGALFLAEVIDCGGDVFGWDGGGGDAVAEFV